MKYDIYLDNAATTEPSIEVIKKITDSLKKNWGNASSLHKKGFKAFKYIEQVREKLANVVGSDADEILFTSGGTEANNLAIFGVAKTNKIKKRGKNKIITTMVEHASVLEPCRKLQESGFEVIYLKPTKQGTITDKQIIDVLDENTLLVSMMSVNNETGQIFSVEKIKNLINRKSPDVLLHVDAAQSFLKIPINVNEFKCDLLTITAHKAHGPQGIGALFVRKGIKLCPLLFGGEQEKKLRPGTKNIALILGFGEILLNNKVIKENFKRVKKINDFFKEKILQIDGVILNEVENPFPYILNFSVPGLKSEIILNFLSERNIFVSSAAACSKNKRSHVLTAMGLPNEYIDSAIRISFSNQTTFEEIKEFLYELEIAVKNLKDLKTAVK
ncbi:MAG: cysteine desulfurase [Oscillospiraceae bacterium]|jgi:cysteine desulfurase|nr:cysteine desulfurase [Oscillospiraceae bacterium]